MNTKTLSAIGLAVLLTAASLPAHATVIGLFDYAFNVDGIVTSNAAPGGIDLTAFDAITGLGNITATISGADAHTFDAFFDHEIDENLNTFFNENGSMSGIPAVGQSWEIDEPGYVFGDIYDNFINTSLDNTNAVPKGLEDDVSMAIGWDFILAANETATISMLLNQVQPTSGFYLQQHDPDSDANVFLSGVLSIGSTPPPGVSEPHVLLLLVTGLIGMGVTRHRRKAG